MQGGLSFFFFFQKLLTRHVHAQLSIEFTQNGKSIKLKTSSEQQFYWQKCPVHEKVIKTDFS